MTLTIGAVLLYLVFVISGPVMVSTADASSTGSSTSKSVQPQQTPLPNDSYETNPLQLRIEAESSSPNGTTTITFHANNTRDENLTGVVVNVTELPSNWSIVTHADDGGNYRNDSREWLWINFPAGGLRSPNITIQIPNETEPGDYNISAQMSTSDFQTNATAKVSIIHNKSLSIEQTIAGEDNVIQTSEMIEAIGYWSSNEEVPKTDGRRLNTSTILHLIDIWATGEQVASSPT